MGIVLQNIQSKVLSTSAPALLAYPSAGDGAGERTASLS